ncbi:ABC transporter permease [Gorillibacterium timonense]|uniref:ABC transporter permease n=1 Tax=Gorillibacterium timonense TaxID=1689269 RepID=UPI00071C44D9|nr:ABC transporter permease [Gorillibacterium timonense]
MREAGDYFRGRLRANWAFQWRVFRLIVDWTIAVYVILPVAGVVGYNYVKWWIEPPDWFFYVSFDLVRAALFLFILQGTVRYFLEEADQLHFLQGERWADRFRRSGSIYSAVACAVSVGAVAILLTPVLLLNHRLTLAGFLLLFVYIWLYKLAVQLILQFADIRLAGWRLYGAKTLLVATLGAGFAVTTRLFREGWWMGALCCVIAAVLVGCLFRLRLQAKAAFLQDVRRDSKEKYKFVAFILRDQVVKKPAYPRRKPILFRKSGRIFRKRTAANVLAESGLKSLFRNGQQVKSYLMLTGIFAFGSLLTRIGAQDQALFTIIWLISGFILSYYVRLQWGEFQKNAFLGLFSWTFGSWYNALRTYVFTAMLPGFLVIGAAIWLPVLSVGKAVLLLPVAVGVAYVISTVYSSVAAMRMDRQAANR